MTEEEFLELVALGEPRGVELKGPFHRGDKAALKVVRAAMALSNRRDGGYILIGVRERRSKKPELLGLTDDQANSWNYDDVADLFDNYAEPRVVFHVARDTFPQGQFVTIRISEFDDVPVLCKKESAVTQDGACYVYPIGKAQVRPIPRQQDMRELLDIATEKRLRNLLAGVGRAGGEITAAPDGDSIDTTIEDYFRE